MERFKKLLVYAGTDQPEIAISRAVVLAMENEASLTLIDVIKPVPKALGLITGGTAPKEIEFLLAEDHLKKLQDRVAEYSDAGVPIRTIVKVGDPATEVIREVVRNGYDLVIKSADQFSRADRYFGSVARSLLRLCPCSVLLLKNTHHDLEHGDFDQVVAAIDTDATDPTHRQLNDSIVGLASGIAREDQAHLHLVVAWEFPMEAPFRQRAGDAEVDASIGKHEKEIQREVLNMLDQSGMSADDAQIHICRSSAPCAIGKVIEEAQADLLVMGTVCRTGVAGFLIGNTAESVLANVSCSVLALKPSGFECPLADGVRRQDAHAVV